MKGDRKGKGSAKRAGNDDETVRTLQKDALQEIGNIASAHVATTLSEIIGRRIMVDFSESNILPVERLPSSIGNATDEVAAVYMRVYGDRTKKDNSMILLVLPYDKALAISAIFQNKDPSPLTEIQEEDSAVITEIGNICICAYLNALSKFLDTSFIPSPPAIATGMIGAILELPASLIAERSTHAIVINTKFLQEQNTVYGSLLFIPEKGMHDSLLSRFKVIAGSRPADKEER
jgi:chemotaxis protein CheC